MEKITLFFTKYSSLVIVCLLLTIMIGTCNRNREAKMTTKQIELLTKEVQDLKSTAVTKKDLTIEGLKTEKRMIQSTDRKILDVNRQAEIDKELEQLSK